MKIMQKTGDKLGKYLVLKRNGEVFSRLHFVLGPRDQAAQVALLAYAQSAAALGYDKDYVSSIIELVEDFKKEFDAAGSGDPDMGNSSAMKDHPLVLRMMAGLEGFEGVADNAVLRERIKEIGAERDEALKLLDQKETAISRLKGMVTVEREMNARQKGYIERILEDDMLAEGPLEIPEEKVHRQPRRAGPGQEVVIRSSDGFYPDRAQTYVGDRQRDTPWWDL